MGFSIKRPENCADKIWRDLVTNSAKVADAALAKRGFQLHKADFVGLDESGEVRPTVRFIVYSIKQLIVEPQLCGVDPALDEWLVGKFDSETRDAILEAGARRPIKPAAAFQKQNVEAALQAAPVGKRIGLSKAAYYYRHAEIAEGVCEIVNRWRGPDHAPFQPHELFHSPDIVGADAIKRLRDKLVEGLPTRGRGHTPVDDPFFAKWDQRGWLKSPDSFSGEKFRFVTGPGDPRSDMLEQLCDQIFLPDSSHQIVNAHALGMRSDLSALATELFNPGHRSSRRCTLPMLYIPLHGRSLATPKDSYSELAHTIWRFYRTIRLGQPEPRRGSETGDTALIDRVLPEPRGLDQTVRTIRAIQRLMAIHPAVIVFDGYQAGQYDPERHEYSLHNLISAIAGDRLFDLIERLTMIPTLDRGAPVDVHGFRQNRFVVLSDHPLYDADRGMMPLHPHPALRLISGVSIAVGAPQRDLLPGMIASFGNQMPKQIAWIRKEIGGESRPYEANLKTAFEAHTERLAELAKVPQFARMSGPESVVAVLSVLLKLGKGPPFKPLPETLSAPLKTLVRGELLPGLKADADPSWLFFLHLIAITPGGVRPKTLARVYRHFLEAQGNKPIPGRPAINKSIAGMLEAFHGLVEISRSDHLEALHGRPLPLLFRQDFSVPEVGIQTDRAIMFAYDEVRETFTADAKTLEGGRYLTFLHFLLAEEAYEQFTHLARYDDLQGEDSLHRNSRLLAALYHGAASLGSDTLDMPQLYPVAGRFLPDDPRRRWVKLYSFAYRRNLERPPLHHLVRSFDAAQTKLDILLALARPQLCRDSTPPPEPWTLPVLVRTGTGMRELPLSRIAKQFALELREAAIDASRELRVDWQAADLQAQTTREKRAEIDEKILRLTDNATFRAKEVETLSETIMGHISDLVGNEYAPRYLDLIGQHVSAILHGSARSELISPALERKLLLKAAIPIAMRRDLIDYLNLYGEVLGVKADRDYGEDLSRGIETPSDQVMQGFVESFAAFHVAEYLRTQTFWDAPDEARDVISGRAARGFIRVCLKLERFRVTVQRRSGGPPDPGGWFWRHAHDVADELARHLSRFPRERVGMLIIDATMARYYESKNSQIYSRFLRMALECLSSAEPLLLKLGMHNRLRQRFALERSKILAETARLAIAKGDVATAGRYLQISQSDIETVERLATEVNVLWKNLAMSARKGLENLRASMLASESGSQSESKEGHPTWQTPVSYEI